MDYFLGFNKYISRNVWPYIKTGIGTCYSFLGILRDLKCSFLICRLLNCVLIWIHDIFLDPLVQNYVGLVTSCHLELCWYFLILSDDLGLWRWPMARPVTCWYKLFRTCYRHIGLLHNDLQIALRSANVWFGACLYHSVPNDGIGIGLGIKKYFVH